MHGWVRVQSYTDPPDSLLQHREWHTRPPGSAEEALTTVRRVAEAQSGGRGLRVRLDGIEDRDAADSLRLWDVLIERAALPAAGPREYYREDLLGFTVRNVEGVVLGVLQCFMEAPAAPVMWIKGGREHAVPAAPPVLRRVDLDRREIEVDWPADF